MMSCLKCFTSIEAVHILVSAYGNGTYWCMYVEDGDNSYLRHQTVSISEFSAHLEILSGIWVSGPPFLSLWIHTPIPGATIRLTKKTM